MVSADTARMIVGVIGNIISLFLFLSPMPTFVQIWKKGSVGRFSPAPYLAALINCMVWTLYGLPMVHPHSTLVVTINGSGTAIELIYIILFLIYSDKQKRVKVLLVLLVELLFIGIVTVLVLTLAHTHKERSLIVGIICIVFNVMMYASPLAVMKIVITTKSVEFMPFFLSFASFANGIAWTAYGFIRFDPFIVVPNGVGALFGLAQLILYASFYRSTKRLMAERKIKGEVDLSEVVVVDEEDFGKEGAALQNGGAP
ncbi:Bidirectional sugar transporter SWEET7 [Morella rubra]|uniref:Bidirectional sugar transporter SWEET n=1 Tax=Morella rubra TaxID=262757 RepID=A0A6A1UPX0_9ROSI|nr:Bidirectional sugar transporter SWEET7 [Morella rubra]KAB1201140.1 Bidirectional sugar transporter SWEET7 [Morella rubra]